MTRSIEKRSPESKIILQDCFANGLIRKCIGDVVPKVRVRCIPNSQKPWINTEVGAELDRKGQLHTELS